MSSVVISGDSSGTVSLTVPSVAGTNTATLPAATGTVMVSGNMPAFSVYQSSAQTVSGSTWTKIQFQTKEFDTSSAFDNITNFRFQPQVAGYYQVGGQVQVGASTTTITCAIYKNGSVYKYGMNESTAASNAAISVLVYLNGSTDYVEFYGYLVIGQALTAQSTYTYFQASMVRSA